MSAKPGAAVMVEAYSACTGGHLALLEVQPDGTVADLCKSVTEAVASEMEAAGAGSTRCVTQFCAISGGRILQENCRLPNTGLLQDAPEAKTGDGAPPALEFLRRRERQVASYGLPHVKVWNGDSGGCVATLDLQDTSVKLPAVLASPTCTPDGRRELVIENALARIVTAATKLLVVNLRGHEGIIRHACLARDGSKAVTASADGTARLWDAETGKCQAVLRHVDEVLCAAFSADAQQIVTGSLDSKARIWEVKTGKIKELAGHRWAVNAAAFSRDGRTVVTGSDDRTVRIWDVERGMCVNVLEGHRSPVTEVCFVD
ncbi:unnamed protein product [Effrenium voratum]|uniref:Uncharacterized protein n=1 Tax=Effrenium voratum TaxID=2562239 RepID=A0AA36I9D7_9DINO|nr:unnamed protein product [Effrenium voratum]CAJ1435386.1 unnamed protein product [Effrenium voratum]